MSNNRHRNFDGAFPPQQNQPKINIDPSTLSTFHCPNCLNNAFSKVYQYLELPTLVASPPNNTMAVELSMCVNCGGIWHIKQLKLLTPKEREIVRVEREMQHIPKEGEIDG